MKLPKGIVKEEGHEYEVLNRAEANDGTIIKPGFVVVEYGPVKAVNAVIVKAIVKHTNSRGNAEIVLAGDVYHLPSGRVYKDTLTWLSTGSTSKKQLYIPPLEKNEIVTK